MGQAKKGYLATLDGWRTIAILAVVIDHVFSYQLSSDSPLLLSITRIGPNGVSLFFAISGFLICSRLLEEHQATGRISLSGFYIRRASRILPPALTYLTIIGILGLIGWIPVSRLEWWSCVFFFRNYLSAGAITTGWGGYTIHYWSLAVEEHFYLLWPTLLVLTGPRRSRWVAAGLAAAVACWRSWDFRQAVFAKFIPGVLFASRTDTRLDGLLLGCLAALLLTDPRWRKLFLRIMTTWTWAACVAAYLGMQLLFRRHYYTIFESLLLAVIVATTVLRPQMWAGRMLELSGMRWVGRLSYSLYLWQQFFLVPGGKHFLSKLQWFPLNLALLLAMAGLSYRFVERPLIRLGHRLAPPPSPGRQDVEPAAAAKDAVLIENVGGTGPGEAA